MLLAGCDKSLPGMLMAAARLDLAAVFLYAGSTLPGQVDDREDVTIIDAFEAVGACARGLITREEVDAIERAICPGEGACGGMYTANTMAAPAEALGHVAARLGRAARRRPPPRRLRARVRRGRRRAAAQGHHRAADPDQARRSRTRSPSSWRSAARPTPCCTCSRSRTRPRSTSTLDDFNRIGDRVPHLADVKPFGRYVMTDVDRIGGVPVVMKALLDAGLLHGDALTVTGKTHRREPRRHRARRTPTARSSAR